MVFQQRGYRLLMLLCNVLFADGFQGLNQSCHEVILAGEIAGNASFQRDGLPPQHYFSCGAGS